MWKADNLVLLTSTELVACRPGRRWVIHRSQVVELITVNVVGTVISSVDLTHATVCYTFHSVI